MDLFDEYLMARQRAERLREYAENARVYRMRTALRRHRIIETAGQFLVATGNRLLAIAS